jgi:hypothetical protein
MRNNRFWRNDCAFGGEIIVEMWAQMHTHVGIVRRSVLILDLR